MMNPNYIGTNIIGFEVFSAIIYIVEISFEDEGQRSTFFFSRTVIRVLLVIFD